MDPASSSSDSLRRRSVLVVDDSNTMRSSLVMTLELGGYRVQGAADGEQALSLLRGGLRPDLVVTDIVMPGMGGIEFIGKAREILRFTPIVALTTQSNQDLRKAGQTAGATAWALKPTGGTELLALVKRFLPALQEG